MTKTYIPANTHFEVWFMIISTEVFEGLNPDVQAAMQRVAAEFETMRWTVAEQDQAKNEQRLADELGTTVVALSDEQLSAMAEKVRETVWPEVLKDIGEDWARSVLETARD